MNEQIEIKRADLSDLAEIASLLLKYREFYRRKSNISKVQTFVSERLKRSEAVIFLASINDEVVGLCQLYVNFSTLSLGKIWCLNDLYIDENFRGKGIGKKLIDAVIAFSKEDGAVRVDIKTEHDNLPAKSLYEKYGFERDDLFVHFHYPLDPEDTDHV